MTEYARFEVIPYAASVLVSQEDLDRTPGGRRAVVELLRSEIEDEIGFAPRNAEVTWTTYERMQDGLTWLATIEGEETVAFREEEEEWPELGFTDPGIEVQAQGNRAGHLNPCEEVADRYLDASGRGFLRPWWAPPSCRSGDPQ